MREIPRVCINCPVIDLCQQIAVPDKVVRISRDQKDELCEKLLNLEVTHPIIVDQIRRFGNDCWMRPNYRYQMVDLLLDESLDINYQNPH
jgi:hypothetical protein